MRNLRFGKIQSVCFTIMVIGLGVFYFSRPDRVKSTLGPALSSLRYQNPRWIIFQEEDLQETLKGKRTSYWDLNRARAILSRWRLSGVSAAPYGNLLEEYEKGWWISPESAKITSLIEANDQQWISARQEAPPKGSLPEYTTSVQDDRLVLEFSQPMLLVNLGSQLTVKLSSDAPFPRDTGVFWNTNQPSQYPFRYRQGIAKDSSENGKFGRTIVYDMSWQPGWLAPGAKLTTLSFTVPPDSEWILESIEFSDSPYLPLPPP